MSAPTAIGDPPTERQALILELIRRHWREHGFGPTLAELAAAAGLPFGSSVQGHVLALCRKGYVAWKPGSSRTLRVVEAAAPCRCPECGHEFTP